MGEPAQKKARMEPESVNEAIELPPNTKSCPACGIPIEKLDGDDHMMCGCEAGGTYEKALAAGGCGHQFKWSTKDPLACGRPGQPANEKQVKFGKAMAFLSSIRLRPHDLGTTNEADGGQIMLNQCFYLSLAHAYLGNEASDNRSGLARCLMARRLKLIIESAVLERHPEQAAGLSASASGGPAMVFADFLQKVMCAEDTPEEPNLVAKWAVCVLDGDAGHVQVFLGPQYASLDERSQQEQNLILLWYASGHYQCVVCDDDSGTKVHLTYDEFKKLLTEHEVGYIETLE